MPRILMAALFALALAACGAGAAPSSPPAPAAPSDAPTAPASPEASAPDEPSSTPQPVGHTAAGLTLVQFLSNDDPASQVFIVESDGSLRQLTGQSGVLPGASRPVWSPDGEWLAFDPPKVGAELIPDLGVVRADGSAEHVIGQGVMPRWSPDGTRVLFQQVEPVEDESLSMYVAELATGEVTNVGEGYDPRWLPDGRIAFDWAGLGPDGTFAQALRVLSLEDGSVVEIAQNAHGVWSPDGSALLLVDETTIYLADADGSDPRALADGWGPAWSLDGSRIVFAYAHNNDAVPVLAVVDLEGRELWSGAVGESPAWSPDGTRLAVAVSYPEPVVQVLDAATGDVLAELPGSDPTWMP